MIIGVDPGVVTGVCLLDLSGRYVTHEQIRRDHAARALELCGEYDEEPRAWVWIEKQFIARRGGISSSADILRVAQHAGGWEYMAVAHGHAVQYVLPRSWRATATMRTGDDPRIRAALLTRAPANIPEHAAEACLIAYHGWTQWRAS